MLTLSKLEKLTWGEIIELINLVNYELSGVNSHSELDESEKKILSKELFNKIKEK